MSVSLKSLAHSENVYLPAMQPVLQLFVGRLQVVLACQVKMQKNIVNLVEQRFDGLVSFSSF
jgi:hypothetical protein